MTSKRGYERGYYRYTYASHRRRGGLARAIPDAALRTVADKPPRVATGVAGSGRHRAAVVAAVGRVGGRQNHAGENSLQAIDSGRAAGSLQSSRFCADVYRVLGLRIPVAVYLGAFPRVSDRSENDARHRHDRVGADRVIQYLWQLYVGLARRPPQ